MLGFTIENVVSVVEQVTDPVSDIRDELDDMSRDFKRAGDAESEFEEHLDDLKNRSIDTEGGINDLRSSLNDLDDDFRSANLDDSDVLQSQDTDEVSERFGRGITEALGGELEGDRNVLAQYLDPEDRVEDEIGDIGRVALTTRDDIDVLGEEVVDTTDDKRGLMSAVQALSVDLDELSESTVRSISEFETLDEYLDHSTVRLQRMSEQSQATGDGLDSLKQSERELLDSNKELLRNLGMTEEQLEGVGTESESTLRAMERIQAAQSDLNRKEPVAELPSKADEDQVGTQISMGAGGFENVSNIRAAEKAIEDLEEVAEKNNATFDKKAMKVALANDNFEEFNARMRDTRSRLGAVEERTDDNNKSFSRFIATLYRATTEADGFFDGLTRVRRGLKSVEDQSEDSNRKMKKTMGILGNLNEKLSTTSFSMGPFTTQLSTLITVFPPLIALISAATAALGGFLFAALGAGGALAGMGIAGFLGMTESIQGQFAGINNRMDATKALGKAVKNALYDAMAPLRESTLSDGTDMTTLFVQALRGLIDAVHIVSEGLAEIIALEETKDFLETISKAIESGDESGLAETMDAFKYSVKTLLPVLGDLLVALGRRLPGIIEGTTDLAEDLTPPLAKFLQTLGPMIRESGEFGSTMMGVLLPALEALIEGMTYAFIVGNLWLDLLGKIANMPGVDQLLGVLAEPAKSLFAIATAVALIFSYVKLVGAAVSGLVGFLGWLGVPVKSLGTMVRYLGRAVGYLAKPVKAAGAALGRLAGPVKYVGRLALGLASRVLYLGKWLFTLGSYVWTAVGGLSGLAGTLGAVATKVASLVAAINPVTAIIAVLVGLIVLVHTKFDMLMGIISDVKGYIRNLQDRMGKFGVVLEPVVWGLDTLAALFKFIKNPIEAAGEFLGWITGMVEGLVEALTGNTLSESLKTIGSILETLAAPFSLFAGLLGGASDLVSDLAGTVADGAQAFLDMGVKAVEAGKKVAEGLGKSAGELWEGGKDLAGDAIQKGKDVANEAGEAAGDALDSAKDLAGDAAGKAEGIWNSVTPDVDLGGAKESGKKAAEEAGKVADKAKDKASDITLEAATVELKGDLAEGARAAKEEVDGIKQKARDTEVGQMGADGARRAKEEIRKAKEAGGELKAEVQPEGGSQVDVLLDRISNLVDVITEAHLGDIGTGEIDSGRRKAGALQGALDSAKSVFSGFEMPVPGQNMLGTAKQNATTLLGKVREAGSILGGIGGPDAGLGGLVSQAREVGSQLAQSGPEVAEGLATDPLGTLSTAVEGSLSGPDPSGSIESVPANKEQARKSTMRVGRMVVETVKGVDLTSATQPARTVQGTVEPQEVSGSEEPAGLAKAVGGSKKAPQVRKKEQTATKTEKNVEIDKTYNVNIETDSDDDARSRRSKFRDARNQLEREDREGGSGIR
jgi:hypothetical protein